VEEEEEGEKSMLAERWALSGSAFVLWPRAAREMKEDLRAEANGGS